MLRRILIMPAVVVACLCGMSWGIIMTSKSETFYTTEKGTELVLKPDSTWEYKSDRGPRITQDLYEELGDGRLMNIRDDNTWGYAEKNERTKVIVNGLSSVEASSVASNRDVSVANKQVSKEVLEKLANKINTGLYKGAKPLQRLVECVKLVEKSSNSREKFLDDKKLWQVSAEVRMNRDQIIAVAECISEAEKAGKSPKADSAAKPK